MVPPGYSGTHPGPGTMHLEDIRRRMSSQVRALSSDDGGGARTSGGAMHATRGRGDGTKRRGRFPGLFVTFRERVPGSALDGPDVGRLRPLLALGHLELDLLALGE